MDEKKWLEEIDKEIEKNEEKYLEHLKESLKTIDKLQKELWYESDWYIGDYVNDFGEKTGKQFIGKNKKTTSLSDNFSHNLRIFMDEDFELRVFRHSERFLEKIRSVKIKFDNPNLPVIEKDYVIALKAHQVIPYILKCESFKMYVKFPYENKGVLFEIKTKGFKDILEKYNSTGNQKKTKPSKFKRFANNHPFIFINAIFPLFPWFLSVYLSTFITGFSASIITSIFFLAVFYAYVGWLFFKS